MFEPVIETKDATTTYYVVEADCIDRRGDRVVRKLGVVRGPSDNGRPGWTDYGTILYDTLDGAKHAAQFPDSYSVYDGIYKSGEVRVFVVMNCVVTITTKLRMT